MNDLHYARIACRTTSGRIVYRLASLVHGPFAAIEDADGWRVIHTPTGKGATKPSWVETREAAEKVIRQLRAMPLDWWSEDGGALERAAAGYEVVL